MKTRTLDVQPFLTEWKKTAGVLFDSRSPSEYLKGHIPGAISLPLLNDEHRKEIGILYKQKGREAAVLKGFELVGPRFHEIIQTAGELAKDKPVFVYCWRGGMRSNITAWLLSMAGMQVVLLNKGYKSFRHLVLEEFEKPRKAVVLGGKTGSGKTELLAHLSGDGQAVIDLEQLAMHKGSAFGAMGLPPQPSQEHFENLLGYALSELSADEILWLENESRQIGNVNLPDSVYQLIRSSAMVAIDPGDEQRKKRILDEYGCFPTEKLAERTERIGKRLGPQHLKAALQALANNDLRTWLDTILVYYDKTYSYGNELRNPESIIVLSTAGEPFTSVAIRARKAAVVLSDKLHV